MEELQNLIEKYKGILIAKHHLVSLEENLKAEKKRLKKLEAILEKEYNDVVQFENLPLIRLFGTILKSETEQYEIEKQTRIKIIDQHSSRN